MRGKWDLNDVIPKVRFSEGRAVWKISADSKGQDTNIRVLPNEFEDHLKAKNTKRSRKKTKGQRLRFDKRVDHRHHSIDALVIALTTPGLLQKYRRSQLMKNEPFNPEPPLQNITILAENMVRESHIYHVPDRHPPKDFFMETPRGVYGDYLTIHQPISAFAQSKDSLELSKWLGKLVYESTREIIYRHIEKRCRQLDFALDSETRLPKLATREEITKLFEIDGPGDVLYYGVEDPRQGNRYMKKVTCYSYKSMYKAKADSAWTVKAKQGDKTHSHAWQLLGNACLLLDPITPSKSRVLTSIEYHSMAHNPKQRKVYAGDTVLVDGRKMKVREVSASHNTLKLTDIVEASSMKVISSTNNTQTYYVRLGKTNFHKLV